MDHWIRPAKADFEDPVDLEMRGLKIVMDWWSLLVKRDCSGDLEGLEDPEDPEVENSRDQIVLHLPKDRNPSPSLLLEQLKEMGRDPLRSEEMGQEKQIVKDLYRVQQWLLWVD